MPRAKIVHLTSVHPPDDIRIYHKECSTLAQAGYEVVLVAPGEGGACSGAVRVCTVPIPCGRLARMTKTVWQVYQIARAEKAAVYHLHDPELLPLGMLLRLARGRVFYDAHENVPRQIMTKYWIPAPLRRLISGVAALAEWTAALAFNGVIASTPGVAVHFPGGKTVVVQNYPILAELTPGAVPYTTRQPIIAYPGGLSEDQGAREMVEALGLISPQLGARLILAGDFDPPELCNQLQSLPAWRRVEFIGRQSRPGVVQLLSEARIGLALNHPIPNYVDAYSTKMFEYMAAGIPVVVSNFPLWRSIVEEVGCGLAVDPLDVRAIAGAIERLLDRPDEAELMGRRGREAAVKTYNWAQQARRLLECYEKTLAIR